MDRKSWLFGLVMGLCIGVGIGGFYFAQIKGDGTFDALAASTALGTFGDFEWEILYYQVRILKITPYSTEEAFQYVLTDMPENVVMVEGTRESLRVLALENYPISVVFESKTIYIYDFENECFYYWSP